MFWFGYLDAVSSNLRLLLCILDNIAKADIDNCMCVHVKWIDTSEMSPEKRVAAESTGMEWMGSKSGRETMLSSCYDEKERARH